MSKLNSWDTHWDRFYQQSTGNQYPEAHIIRFVAKNYYGAEDRSKINILDLGCGGGCHLWYLAREGFSAHGMDGSPTAIEAAKAKLGREGVHADLHVGDFTALPFADNSMDGIIDAASIQHNDMEAIRAIVNEICRVLKPGGKFFGVLISDSKDLSDKSFSTHFFSKSELQDLFAPFEEISVDETGYTADNGQRSIKFWLVEARARG